MNIMKIITKDEMNNNNASSSTCFESCDIWYDKLGHELYFYINVN
jgi:hypothetical protein